MMDRRRLWIFGLAALAAAILLGLCAGQGGFAVLRGALAGHDPTSLTILLDIRLPRVLMASGIGASLAVSGVIFQTVLHNQLAEPYILGISGGAALGFMAARICGAGLFWTCAATYAGGVLSLAAVLCAGLKRGSHGLLLSGVMVNSFCGALILLAVALADSSDLGRVMYWFLGDIGMTDRSRAWLWLLFFLALGIALTFASRRLDLLLLGDDAAECLGIRARRFLVCMLFGVTLLVSGSVAAAGPIGFVGLVVPHLLRMALGGRHGVLLPASLLSGACFLVLCDAAARMVLAQGELPAGVITAVIGAPLFIFLLARTGRD